MAERLYGNIRDGYTLGGDFRLGETGTAEWWAKVIIDEMSAEKCFDSEEEKDEFYETYLEDVEDGIVDVAGQYLMIDLVPVDSDEWRAFKACLK